MCVGQVKERDQKGRKELSRWEIKRRDERRSKMDGIERGVERERREMGNDKEIEIQ